jgi:hypothetical protein
MHTKAPVRKAQRKVLPLKSSSVDITVFYFGSVVLTSHWYLVQSVPQTAMSVLEHIEYRLASNLFCDDIQSIPSDVPEFTFCSFHG